MVLVLLGLLGTGAAQASEPEEDNFDGSWCTATSKHFVIYTYGGARVAQRALEEAEQTYQALRLVFFAAANLPEDPKPLNIVLFSTDYAYNLMVGKGTDGVFRSGLSFGESDFVFLRRVGQFAVLRHELTHRLVREFLPQAPPWLNEGLAQYYQWMQITDDAIVTGSTAELRPVQAKLHDSPYFPPLAQLLALPRSKFYGEHIHGVYSASFWLIETLNADATNRARFQKMLRDMARGVRADVAWQRAFSDEETRRLDAAYRLTREQQAPASLRVPWQAPHAEVSRPRRLTLDEQHLLIARILGRRRGYIARRELDAALQSNPKNAEALAQRALLESEHRDAQRQDAAQAVSLDERLPLGWQAVAVALLSGPVSRNDARATEIAGRLEQFIDSVDSRCLAALIFAALGERARAFTLARKIAREAPRALSAQVVFARIAKAVGNTKEAAAAMQAAWALSPDGVDPGQVEALLLPSLPAPSAVKSTLEFNGDKTAAVAAAPSIYLAQIQRKIADFWSPPAALRALSEAEYVRERAVLTTIQVTLNEEGRISATESEILSGIGELDEAAIVAIRRAQPFSKIPEEAARPFRVRLRFAVPLLPPAPR